MTRRAVLVFSFLLFTALCEAAVWENIPSFPRSQKARHEETLVNNHPILITVYVTLSSREEIVEFYKKKLVNFGWKLETELSEKEINVLVFSKEKAFVNISVQNISEKNFITVAQSKLIDEPSEDKTSCPECEGKLSEFKRGLALSAESEEKAKESIKNWIKREKENAISKQDTRGRDLRLVPRYPGAVRVNDIEKENGKKITLNYYVKDSIENVADFYRQNMDNYYWRLENEIDFQNLPEALAEKMPVNIQGQTLVFKNSSASCIISIIEEPQTKATIIGVNYTEK